MVLVINKYQSHDIPSCGGKAVVVKIKRVVERVTKLTYMFVVTCDHYYNDGIACKLRIYQNLSICEGKWHLRQPEGWIGPRM